MRYKVELFRDTDYENGEPQDCEPVSEMMPCRSYDVALDLIKDSAVEFDWAMIYLDSDVVATVDPQGEEE